MALQKIDPNKSLVYRPCDFSHLVLAKDGNKLIPLKAVKADTELNSLIRELKESYGVSNIIVLEANRWTQFTQEQPAVDESQRSLRAKPDTVSLTNIKNKHRRKVDIKVSQSRISSSSKPPIRASSPVPTSQLSSDQLEKMASSRNKSASSAPAPAPAPAPASAPAPAPVIPAATPAPAIGFPNNTVGKSDPAPQITPAAPKSILKNGPSVTPDMPAYVSATYDEDNDSDSD